MFLTRLRLDPAHPQARRDLASAYEMHRTLSRAFSDSPDAVPARFLWRLEPPAHGDADAQAVVLVQAAVSARWPVLTDLPGYLHHGAEEKHVDLGRLLQPGRSCGFRLLCNPTVTRNGKRLGLMRESEQHEWLLRVADPDKMVCVLARGVGHGKALGLGMLSIAPLQRAD